jgi:hypothetical protein
VEAEELRAEARCGEDYAQDRGDAVALDRFQAFPQRVGVVVGADGLEVARRRC